MLGDTALRLHQTDTDIEPISATPTPGGLDLCLRCQLPLDEFKQHLDVLGIEVELGPVARQGANGAIESVYLRDPDGNLLEICRPAR